MRIKTHILLICIGLILPWNLGAQNGVLKKTNWGGYVQLRGISNFDDNHSFMLRRMKLWLKSSPEFSEHWSYKLQTTISSFNQEKFFLQDVKVSYKKGTFSLDIGQFIPAFSLQWDQPDWKINAIERAKVVNNLSPSGTLGVRDLGIQSNFTTQNKFFITHLGIFNGNGIKEYRFNNKGFMLTHKSEINFPLRVNNFRLGYSFLYRKAYTLGIPRVMPDTIMFSGNDLRYNLFALFQSQIIDLQTEYIAANFEGDLAQGYYIFSTIKFRKNQLVLGYEDYQSLINTSNNPYYRLGYNYLIRNNKIKLFFDHYFQIINGELVNYMASIQLQMFLN